MHTPVLVELCFGCFVLSFSLFVPRFLALECIVRPRQLLCHEDALNERVNEYTRLPRPAKTKPFLRARLSATPFRYRLLLVASLFVINYIVQSYVWKQPLSVLPCRKQARRLLTVALMVPMADRPSRRVVDFRHGIHREKRFQ